MKRIRFSEIFYQVLFFLLLGFESLPLYASGKPNGIVLLSDLSNEIIIDMRYYIEENFVGRRLDGYKAAKCYLSQEAAEGLRKAQEKLNLFSLKLRVFDCYRPQKAVDQFVQWAKDLGDTKMKSIYYPKVEKKHLFRDGYIAEKSGHSRASTVDLTIDGLDMGTRFDFFDPLSHTNSSKHGKQVRANRALLVSIMEEVGFRNLPEEWWHFTLKDEPYKDRYFNFDIQ